MVNPVAVREAPRIPKIINDNYCRIPPELQTKLEYYVSDVKQTDFHVLVKNSVKCQSVACLVHSVTKSKSGQPQKKGVRPISNMKNTIKSVKSASFVNHCVFAPNVPNALSVANVQPVGGATTNVLGSMGTTRCKPKSSVHTKRGLCSPIQSQTLPSEGSPDSKRLCQSHQLYKP